MSGSSTAIIGSAKIEVQGVTGGWQQLALLPASATASGWSALGRLITSALPAGDYSVRAVGLAPNGSILETTASAPIHVVHSAVAPASVAARVLGDTVSVSWSAPTSDLSLTFSVYRSETGATGYALAGSGLTSTTFADAYLPGGANVSYVVTATDPVGNESAFSASAHVSTPAVWNLQAPSVSLLPLLGTGSNTIVAASAATEPPACQASNTT